MVSGAFSARVGRRGLLAGAVVAGAALATGRGAAAAGDERTVVRHGLLGGPTAGGPAPDGPVPGHPIPQVLAATGSAASAPDFPIGYVGLSWSGDGNGGRIRLRTAAGWGSWRPVRPGDSGDDGRGVALIPAGGAAEVDLEPPPGADDVQLLAINTTDGPATGRLIALPTRRYGSRYRSRASWGADESWRFGPGSEELWPAEFHTAQALTVHHTVTANNDPDPAATVRAIYYFQAVTQAWGDLGYHLLIDQAGVVYEGRYSGADAVSVFQAATRPPQLVDAGHALGHNPGNIGVALLGDLTATQPTAAARRALVWVLASLAQATGLDPQGRTNYVNPVTGAARTVDTIAGHRDWLATQCPGNAFYPNLPGVRSDAATLLDRGILLR
jgi:hypothetical protein